MRLVALGRILALLICLGALAQPAGFGQNDQLPPPGEPKSEPAPPAEPAGGAQEAGEEETPFAGAIRHGGNPQWWGKPERNSAGARDQQRAGAAQPRGR